MQNVQTILSFVATLLRILVPYALMAVMFVLNIVNIPYMQEYTVKLPLVLMSIYYWGMYRPTLIPIWLVFVLGLGLDLLTMVPMGLHALIFVVAQRLVVRQRRYLMGQSFTMQWFGFSMLALFAEGARWTIFGAVYQNWFFDIGLVFSFAISCLAFPFIHMLLYLVHRILPTPIAKKSTRSFR